MSSHHHLHPSSGEVDHIHLVSENIGALYLSEDYSDVTLIVAGEKFKAHKLVLAARSEYFRALLFGGMKESLQNEIVLPTATLSAFKILLKYIYTGRMSLYSERDEVRLFFIIAGKYSTYSVTVYFHYFDLLQVVLDTLGLAHLFGFLDLESAISDYLREVLSIKNVCLIIDTALLYQLDFLIKVSIMHGPLFQNYMLF